MRLPGNYQSLEHVMEKNNAAGTTSNEEVYETIAAIWDMLTQKIDIFEASHRKHIHGASRKMFKIIPDVVFGITV